MTPRNKRAVAGEVCSGFLANPTLHLHPTLRCNLSCRHCYSNSSPAAHRGQDATSYLEAARVLRSEGYRLVSLSGGEALLYEDIERLIEGLRSLGYRLTLISNGATLQPRFLPCLRMLAGVAVSFDGTRETHNGIRGHHHAFDSALRGLDFLHAHRIPSAVAVCVSKRSIGELPDIAEVAVGHGATALQLRPFVVTGRAREAMPDEALDDDDVNLLVLLSLSLQQEFGRHLRVHCDLSSAQAVLAHRAQFAALVESNSGAHQALARMVNPLVLKEDGTLRPFTYDFAPDYDIGRIGPDLVESIGRFKNGGCTALARVVEDAFHMLEGRAGFIDWYDHCRVIGEKTTRRERQMPGRWTTLERSASGEPSHSSG